MMKLKPIMVAFSCLFVTGTVSAGEGPALDPNLITQSDIESGALSLREIRIAGGKVYSTPFNLEDGLGDGAFDTNAADKTGVFSGNRPRLQNPFTPFLRVNGLDTQTCLECHSIHSRATVPPTLVIGGHGGFNNSAFPNNKNMDIDDSDQNGFAAIDGRVINPPFNFGDGGIELVGKEMTTDLQAIRQQAINGSAGQVFQVVSKGIDFGTITADGNGGYSTDLNHSIDDDLVVRPFGRKGENFTVRDFDRGAMAFHIGMQAQEVVGFNVDQDNDGVVNEVTPGEMSALSVFINTLPRPIEDDWTSEAEEGAELFNTIGCASCHTPEFVTNSKHLTQSFPDIADDPSANVFMSINLARRPASFEKSGNGIKVRMFADLKRHDMGPDLEESNTNPDGSPNALNRFFTTARLWGVADSAPYMHDGRALTITDAILAHGGEAAVDRQNFINLSDNEKDKLLAFLRSLRVPKLEKLRRIERMIRNN